MYAGMLCHPSELGQLSLQVHKVVVAEVCTVAQLADSRQQVDVQLAKFVEDIQSTQIELASRKVG